MSEFVTVDDNESQFIDACQQNLLPLLRIDSLDLLTLRTHALLEIALQDLLATRLNTSKKRVIDLTFARLATLALSGVSDRLMAMILDLNRIRNHVAHSLGTPELQQKILVFARRYNLTTQECTAADISPRVWGDLLFTIANGVALIPWQLRIVRSLYREATEGAKALDEPTFLLGMGEMVSRSLGAKGDL